MFLKLQSNKMLNMRYLQDVFQGFHEKNVVVIYLTNGNKFVEKYASENEAKSRVEEIKNLMGMGGGLSQKDSLEDFPEKGLTSQVYIAKDTGQTYYWDKETNTYVTTGTAGRTGIYSYNNDLPSNVGLEQEINKTDLIKLVNPTVEYMNGSEVIAKNNVHGIIISSTNNTVKVKTTVDLTIESFKQVSRESDLPNIGSHETLYYVKETNKLYSYDSIKNKYIDYNSADQVDQKIEDHIQMLYWDGKTDQTGIDFWNDVKKRHEEGNDILVVYNVYVYGQIVFSFQFFIEASKYFNLRYYGMDISGLVNRKIEQNEHSVLYRYRYEVSFTIDSADNIVSVTGGYANDTTEVNLLLTNENYSHPYIPQYPGSPTTKKYVDDADADLQEQIDTKEDKSNKVTSLSAQNTDVQYPSAKCVYDSQAIQDAAILELERQLDSKVEEVNNNIAIIASASDLAELNQSGKTLLDLIKSLQASLSSIQDQLGDVQDLLDEINGESTPANPSISDMLDDVIGENIEEPNG